MLESMPISVSGTSVGTSVELTAIVVVAAVAIAVAAVVAVLIVRRRTEIFKTIRFPLTAVGAFSALAILSAIFAPARVISFNWLFWAGLGLCNVLDVLLLTSRFIGEPPGQDQAPVT